MTLHPLLILGAGIGIGMCLFWVILQLIPALIIGVIAMILISSVSGGEKNTNADR